MNHTSRGLISATRKRKDRTSTSKSTTTLEDSSSSSFYSHRGSFVNHNKYSKPGSSKLFPEPGSGKSNRVLAGYMAHEFLTKGTLFGQKFDPARAEAVPVSAAEPKWKHGSVEPVLVKPSKSYADVAQLVKGDGGAHIPGVVNPTQLARWIQM